MTRKEQHDPDILKFNRMEEFIQNQYFRNISIEDIAASGGVCRSKCFSLFNSIACKSPNDYLNDYRLKISTELLSTSLSPISLICQECGFSSQSYFSSAFFKKYGKTPSAWRKENFNASKEKKSEFQKNMYEAISALSWYFYKILKVDLNEDTYCIIKSDFTDHPESEKSKEKLSVWFKEFSSGVHLHEEDKIIFNHVVNLNYIRSFFEERKAQADSYIRLRYRRLVGEKYKWVLMEIVPSSEFSLENQKLFLYIRDIDDDYLRELEAAQFLQIKCNTDALTGLQNRNAFEELLIQIDEGNSDVKAHSTEKIPLGIIYSDLNGLKYINDNFGHGEGDSYIKSFTSFIANVFGHRNCYRMGGDEFLVVIQNITQEKFLEEYEAFRNSCSNLSNTSVSSGGFWIEDSLFIKTAISAAEKMMYAEKKSAHLQNPKWTRN